MSGPNIRRDAEWAAQQDVFRKRHFIRLERFVDPRVLARLLPMLRIAGKQLRTKVHREGDRLIARELFLPLSAPLSVFLYILLNQPRLFAAIGEFTQCDEAIRSFTGRYRVMPSGGKHFDTWHSDYWCGRRLGLSINLSVDPVVGGELQIRQRGSREIQKIAPGRFGDATLFRLGPSLIHRVCPVRSAAPKCGYVGWFTTKPMEVPWRPRSAVEIGETARASRTGGYT